MGYTLDQLIIFSDRAVELEKERRANDIADNAIAAQGDSKAIMEKIKGLLS